VLFATPEYNRGHVGRAEERDRLGVAPGAPVDARRQARRGDGRHDRDQRHRQRAAPDPRGAALPGRQTLPQELLVSRAGEKFDEAGDLTDPETRAELKVLLEDLAAWSVQVREALAVAA
jgi:hypothetical protein